MRQLLLCLAFGVVMAACGGGFPPPVDSNDAGVDDDAGVSEGDAGTVDAGALTDAGPQPSSPVRINEVYVDRNLSGDRVEYVELSGPVGEWLGPLHLRLLGPDGGVRYDLAATRSDAGIGATGTWVIGGSDADGRVDETYNIANWGLDNSKGAVQLVKRSGATVELVDVLGYGAPIPSPMTPPTATSESSVVSLPSSASNALGRRPGASDTHDSAADFCIQAASCGEVNGPCVVE